MSRPIGPDLPPSLDLVACLERGKERQPVDTVAAAVFLLRDRLRDRPPSRHCLPRRPAWTSVRRRMSQRRGPQPTLGDSYESDKMAGGSPFVSAEAVLSAEAVIYESAARAALRAEALAREAEEATRRENSMQKRQLDGRVCALISDKLTAARQQSPKSRAASGFRVPRGGLDTW